MVHAVVLAILVGTEFKLNTASPSVLTDNATMATHNTFISSPVNTCREGRGGKEGNKEGMKE